MTQAVFMAHLSATPFSGGSGGFVEMKCLFPPFLLILRARCG